MTAIVDAHQHFWSVERGDYPWLTPALGPLYRDYLPADLQARLKALGIDRTILVQAAPTEAETAFLLRLAERHPFIAGVVGWADLAAPDAVAAIERAATNPKLVGFRPMLQDMEDATWILSANLRPALRAMVDAGLCFDALIRPQQIKIIETLLLHHHPDLKLVVDHAGNPPIGQDLSSWAADIRRLAANTQAYCKWSGLRTIAQGPLAHADLRCVFDVLIEAFGPERLMWGSDWPVLNLASSYEDWFDESAALFAGLTADQRFCITSRTATGFYLQPRLAGGVRTCAVSATYFAPATHHSSH
jgi:L-fuconolactonase